MTAGPLKLAKAMPSLHEHICPTVALFRRFSLGNPDAIPNVAGSFDTPLRCRIV